MLVEVSAMMGSLDQLGVETNHDRFEARPIGSGEKKGGFERPPWGASFSLDL